MPPSPSSRQTTIQIPARDLRLRRHADYQRVYNSSRKQFAKEMSFFFALRPPNEPEAILTRFVLRVPAGPRIGLTVGKVLGKAVDRNRIKRRLREAVRRHAALLDGLAVDVILHPRRSALTESWPALEREVAQVFRTVRKLAGKAAPDR